MSFHFVFIAAFYRMLSLFLVLPPQGDSSWRELEETGRVPCGGVRHSATQPGLPGPEACACGRPGFSLDLLEGHLSVPAPCSHSKELRESRLNSPVLKMP